MVLNALLTLLVLSEADKHSSTSVIKRAAAEEFEGKKKALSGFRQGHDKQYPLGCFLYFS